MESSGPALCDVAHFATEWPWLPVAADVLHRDLSGRVEVAVSRRRTDPWTWHEGSERGSGRAIGRLTPGGSPPGKRGSVSTATTPPGIGHRGGRAAAQRPQPVELAAAGPDRRAAARAAVQHGRPDARSAGRCFYWLQLAFVALGVATTVARLPDDPAQPRRAAGGPRRHRPRRRREPGALSRERHQCRRADDRRHPVPARHRAGLRGLALAAGGDDLMHLDEWGLGGRSFGSWITWFLLGGDLYTAYTFVAVPALMFGAGAAGLLRRPVHRRHLSAGVPGRDPALVGQPRARAS